MTDTSVSALADLSAFLVRLEDAKIFYSLASVRDGAVMVEISVPGERWEVEFFPDRVPEIEIFRSDGQIGGADLIDRLFAEHSD